MWCPEKLKLNKFIDVDLPEKRQIFERAGGYKPIAPDASQYAGDDDTAILGETKTDMMARTSAELYEQFSKEEAIKEKGE